MRLLIAAAVLCLFIIPAEAKQCIQWHPSGDGSYAYVKCPKAREVERAKRPFQAVRPVVSDRRSGRSGVLP